MIDTEQRNVSKRKMIDELAEEHDDDGMDAVIQRIPNQIEIALEQPMPPIPKGPFEKVILVGMGGSAFPMDVVIDMFAEQLKVRPTVLRNYELPSSVDDKTLIIASSFSGGTEEVTSAIKHFPKKASNVVVLTRELPIHGVEPPRLFAMAKERGYPMIEIPANEEPKGFQPRSALGYMVTFLARLLSCARVMEDPIPQLQTIPRFLREVEIRADAEDAALWLSDKIPVVYTDEVHLMSVARITKIKFNENSERPAFFNALPEANHNEMIGFTKSLGNFGVLYFHDFDSHPRIRHRFNVMKKVCDRASISNVSFREWEMAYEEDPVKAKELPEGAIRIQRILAALVFADWCSYTLALLDKRNPTPVELVESFKTELGTDEGSS